VSRRLAQGSLYAFLERKQNLKWIVSMIIRSGVRGNELREVFNEFVSFGDTSRFEHVRKACEDLGLFSSSSII